MRWASTRLFNLSENSMTGDTPWTVIVSDWVPTSSLKSALMTPLGVTSASRETLLNPCSSVVTLYRQIGSWGSRSPPVASVIAARVNRVSEHTALTATPGSTPPVESVTVPVMSPVVRWAEAVAAPNSATAATMTPTPQRDCDMKVAPFEVGRCDVKVSAFVGPGGGVVKSYAQGKK